jgi:hypothetical protein
MSLLAKPVESEVDPTKKALAEKKLWVCRGRKFALFEVDRRGAEQHVTWHKIFTECSSIFVDPLSKRSWSREREREREKCSFHVSPPKPFYSSRDALFDLLSRSRLQDVQI